MDVLPASDDPTASRILLDAFESLPPTTMPRQRYLRISAIRRALVSLAWSGVCAINACRLAVLLVAPRQPNDDDLARTMRFAQLALFAAQAYVTASSAICKQEHAELGFNAASWAGNLAPLTTLSSGKGFMFNEVLRLVLHTTLSYFPLQPWGAAPVHACTPPIINTLMQQIVMAAYIAMVGVPLDKVLLSWTFTPGYWFLDWRYASLNSLPGCATLAGYMLRRGLLLLAAKIFFSGVPTLIVTQSNRAQQVAIYAICLPLLAVQCFVSGWRVFNGIDHAGMWEVWLATVVSFGVGTDVGHVIEELRAQFSKVRMIADDVLPHHVVDSLMKLPTADDLELEDEHMQDLSNVPSSSSAFAEHRVCSWGGAGGGSSSHGGSSAVTAIAAAARCMGTGSGTGTVSGNGPSPFTAVQRAQMTLVQAASQVVQAAAQGGSGTAADTSTGAADTRPGDASSTRPDSGSSQERSGVSTGAEVDANLRTPPRPSASAGNSTKSIQPSPAQGQAQGQTSRSRSAELPALSAITLRRPLMKRRSVLASDPAQAEYAEEHPRACVLFADVVNFTGISEGTPPGAIVYMLNKLFSKLDDAISLSSHLYKLDVIGDCYMVASGLRWHDGDPCPARSITDFGKLVLQTAATVMDPTTQEPLRMRVGIHKGPVVGALLGCLRRKYTILGDAVNTASRLESTSQPGAIHISASVCRELFRMQMRLGDTDSIGQEFHTPLEMPHFSYPGVEAEANVGLTQLGFSTGNGRFQRSAAGTPARGLAAGREVVGHDAEVDSVMQCDDGSVGGALVAQGLLSIGEGGGQGAGLDSGRSSARRGYPLSGCRSISAAGPDFVRGRPSNDFGNGDGGKWGSPRVAEGREDEDDDEQDAGLGASAEEKWEYQGMIELKGRAPLETYLLQVV